MKKKFTGKVERVASVATVNDVNLTMFGVLFSGETEWLRVCTTKLEMAEQIAFLLPGADVELEIKVDRNHKYQNVLKLTIKG